MLLFNPREKDARHAYTVYNPQEKDAWYVLFTRRKKTRDVLFFIPQDKEVYCALILRAGKGQEVCSYLWFSHPMHFP